MEIKPSYPIRYTPSSLPLAHRERHRESRREAELKLKNNQKLAERNDRAPLSFKETLEATSLVNEQKILTDEGVQQGGFSVKV